MSAAARHLKVNQTTVTRRIAAIEQDLSTRLFRKENGRQILTDMGQTINVHAEALELNILAISHAVSDSDAALSGSVRVTAVESLISNFVIPRMADFHHRFPNIKAEFVAENNNLYIERREADIAIRLARPDHGNMIISKMGNVGFSVYGVQEHRRFRTASEWQALPWITYDETLSQIPEMQWLQDNFQNLDVRMTTSSAISLASAIRSGIGIGVLPCVLGDSIDGIERLTGPDPVLQREAWLILHKDLNNTPRFRQMANWLKELVVKNRGILEGYIQAVP